MFTVRVSELIVGGFRAEDFLVEVGGFRISGVWGLLSYGYQHDLPLATSSATLQELTLYVWYGAAGLTLAGWLAGRDGRERVHY